MEQWLYKPFDIRDWSTQCLKLRLRIHRRKSAKLPYKDWWVWLVATKSGHMNLGRDLIGGRDAHRGDPH